MNRRQLQRLLARNDRLCRDPIGAAVASDLHQRQALYSQLAEHIWNPDRLQAAANGSGI